MHNTLKIIKTVQFSNKMIKKFDLQSHFHLARFSHHNQEIDSQNIFQYQPFPTSIYVISEVSQ